MDTFENWRDRVGHAAQTVRATDEERRDQKGRLIAALSGLESRFNARSIELDHIRGKIVEIEAGNMALGSLIDRLAGSVETMVEAEAQADAPHCRAIRMAEGLVALSALRATANGPDGRMIRFEDVSFQELVAEDLGEDPLPAAGSLSASEQDYLRIEALLVEKGRARSATNVDGGTVVPGTETAEAGVDAADLTIPEPGARAQRKRIAVKEADVSALRRKIERVNQTRGYVDDIDPVSAEHMPQPD